jgi:hypothetical protein
LQLSCIKKSYAPYVSISPHLRVSSGRSAQERPTSSPTIHLEEPGNLEIAAASTVRVREDSALTAPWVEIEYGVTGRWTTELYLEGISTQDDSTISTGWRLENRFRPLKREHWINPVLYFEYESINEASGIAKEIVGNAEISDESNAELRRVHAHELETKLILSSTVHDWNISENFIVEKNLSEEEGFEFGYAFGVYRPLSSLASGQACRFCRENFAAGFEVYGGLGSTNGFGFKDTAHYFAPVLAWQVSENSTLRFSPGIGLTDVSAPALIRFGYSYEIHGFGQKVAHLFGGHS